MQVTVYLDVFFLWNCCLDFILLTITGYVIKQKISFRKRLIGAAFGAVCAIGAVVGKKTLWAVLCYSIGICLMTGITFGFYSIKQTAKNIITLITVAFCMGGILLSFFEQKEGKSYLRQMACIQLGEWRGNLVFELFLAISILFPVLAFFYFRKITPKTEEFLYQVTLKKGGYQYCARGYLDSGNSLIEPTTKLPVILIEAEEMEQFLQVSVPLEGEIPMEQGLFWRAIPYHSAGKEHGILWGLKLDELVLEKNGEQWRTNQVMAAACHHLFSEKRKKEGYSVLLHRNFTEFKN